jgi:putative transposase
MARRPRLPLVDLPLHIVQRGNDRRRCFFEDGDYRFYLRWLAEAAARYRVSVHAYALMTNHVHILATPLVAGGISRMMQSVGSRYVKHVNARTGRIGTLWESRYKACLVERDAHLLAACRYIDLNPVRAGIVERPEEYCWSSYSALAELRTDAMVMPHSALDQLGTPRGSAYARWCGQGVADWELDGIREATAREVAFGSNAFKAQIASLMLRDPTARAVQVSSA